MTKRNQTKFALFFPRPWVLVLLMGLAAAAGCGGGGGGVVGNRGGDGVAPVLTMTSPAQAGRVSDVEFLKIPPDQPFSITVNYADTSPMAFNTIHATLKMDAATAQDITSYFARVDASTIRTNSDFYVFTNSLFDIRTSDTSRVMTLTLSIQDEQQNVGNLTTTFTVFPDGPAAP